MIEVSKISDFASTSFIAPFTGKNYDESIKRALEWEQRNSDKVKLISYYKQTFMGRSILVEYQRIENENK